MPGRVQRHEPPRDDGYATAETAVALPSLLVVLAMAVWVLSCVGAQLRCVDAARAAARSAARGDPLTAAAAAGRRLSPAGSVVRLQEQGAEVRVDVSVSLRPFGHALRLFPPVRISAAATAEREGSLPAGPTP